MSRARRQQGRGRVEQALRRWLVRTVVAPAEARLARVVREVVAAEVDRAIGAVHEMEFRARRDLLAAGERDAAIGSARFAALTMPTARAFHDRESTLEYGVQIAPRGGLALEFGVFEGRSLEVIARERGRREVYGFDSFKGLPEDYRPHVRAGAFAVGGLPDVAGAELVVGWFEDTLPGFLDGHPGTVDLVHVDGDLYSSAVTVLDLVGPRLAAGSVLVFDEFFNFPGWEQHEFRAWQEWLARTGAQVEYEAYTSNNEQVVVRITDPGRP
ncbi:class I SAM-dependent methyltransferase [Geodermatophilus sabuli]|uniref:Methyltransferase domain-containing protein n=1 Tax=Geodermatophilus sabuli TaxID=1564158 RepID=A0A285EKA7_9ACTN|nr:class I SAM-dependent methyltransferase [Geodermatophilus sabuli]MBB3086101.1 putative O-methyltransferase YrrM [Geodermatophilus sabuli]SNX98441.1 Methyltransferase domain-containing protein [Geodermatophilus sabuli]